MIELCVITANVLNMMIMRKVLASDRSGPKTFIFLESEDYFSFHSRHGRNVIPYYYYFIFRQLDWYLHFYRFLWYISGGAAFVTLFHLGSSWPNTVLFRLAAIHPISMTILHRMLTPTFFSFLLWLIQGLLNLSEQINAQKSKIKSLCDTMEGGKEFSQFSHLA